MFKNLVFLGIIFLPLILWNVWSNTSKNSSNSSMLYMEKNNENDEKVLNEDLSKYFSYSSTNPLSMNIFLYSNKSSS